MLHAAACNGARTRERGKTLSSCTGYTREGARRRRRAGLGGQRGDLHLVLASGLGARGRGGLEQLDRRSGLLLELLERVLRLLEGGLQLLVLLLSVGHGLLHRGELVSALGGIHRDVRLQRRQLVSRAVLLRVDRAARAQLGLDELGERREVAAALVVLALLIGRVVVLDRGVATNALLVAQRFVARSAINVSDEDRLGILELSAQGVPVGLHLLAMPSPGRKELDKGRLARVDDLLLPVLRRKLGGLARRARQGGEEHQTTHHVCDDP